MSNVFHTLIWHNRKDSSKQAMRPGCHADPVRARSKGTISHFKILAGDRSPAMCCHFRAPNVLNGHDTSFDQRIRNGNHPLRDGREDIEPTEQAGASTPIPRSSPSLPLSAWYREDERSSTAGWTSTSSSVAFSRLRGSASL